jgi:predicted SnoaL-like aldol condensation-catalyzing enzyme
MPGTNEALVVRWFEEVWNQERRETIDEMVSPTAILNDEHSRTTGSESFKAFYDDLRSQFSDIRVKTHELISSGDLTSVRWTSTLKHRATGKEVSVAGMSMMRFTDGQMAEAWQSWDKFGLMEQLGAKPLKQMYVAAAGSD